MADANFEVEITGACEAWRGHEPHLTKALIAAAAAEGVDGVVSLLLGDDERIAVLNHDFRGKHGATNVLSFPAPASPPSEGGHPRLLGDIVIAYETTAREAGAEARPFRHHLTHLAVHGFLHLLGHDHVAEAEAEAMEALEIAVLARLDVPNPYLSPLPAQRAGEA